MMNELEKVINHIKAQSLTQCEETAQKGVLKCEEARKLYAKKEQDEYWKFLGAAMKDAEERLAKLGELARKEADKKLQETRREMADAAFDLAAEKISELTESEYRQLLQTLNLSHDFTPHAIVDRYKELLRPSVESVMFD